MISLFLIIIFVSTVLGQDDPLGSPDSASFKYNSILYDDEYQFTFYWNIIGTDTLEAMIQLKSNIPTPFSKSWASIGLGTSMLNSEFLMCHNSYNSTTLSKTASLHEHISQKKYLVPVNFPNNEEITFDRQAVGNDKLLSCYFKRKLSIGDGIHKSINIDQDDMIWAFSPVSTLNYLRKYASYHSDEHRGAFKISLKKGTTMFSQVSNFGTKATHGIGMMIVWLIMIPFGVFYARYARSIQGWVTVKSLCQLLAVLLTFCFAIVVFFSGPIYTGPHIYIGIIILVFVFAEAALGFANVSAFSNETAARYKRPIKLIHQSIGMLLMLFSIVQIGLGIDILYPLVEPTTYILWVFYFGAIFIWFGLFFVAEIYYRAKFVQKDSGFKEPSNEYLKLKMEEKTTALEVYTWKSIDAAIMNGKMLAIADNKFVYDISNWISSHPGGQLVLQAVNGTDITNDYFHEAGFDAAEFVPRIDNIKMKERSSTVLQKVQDVAKSEFNPDQRFSVDSKNESLFEQATKSNALITKSDFTSILRARRTHVHTKRAIEKLSKLVIGTLSQKQETAGNASNAFDPDEYRRYALTKIEILSQPHEPKRTLLMKFCLLYPFGTRVDYPKSFLAGQCIELQIRLPSGKRICRYYTPINGDLNAFEILVRLQPQGAMSLYLSQEEVGARQFKIRGPYGKPHFGVPSRFGYTDLPDTIYFISGGTGITPCLQFIHNFFLSVNCPVFANQKYTAELPDELSLGLGDAVSIDCHYYDGM
ncbi:hypothetical protein BC833DRAFT_59460 [Globomyces pollinis-pini]|nr:hypothetical protein BC833DRAFT_59460 [Globomyces pollinis-pini]